MHIFSGIGGVTQFTFFSIIFLETIHLNKKTFGFTNNCNNYNACLIIQPGRHFSNYTLDFPKTQKLLINISSLFNLRVECRQCAFWTLKLRHSKFSTNIEVENNIQLQHAALLINKLKHNQSRVVQYAIMYASVTVIHIKYC